CSKALSGFACGGCCSSAAAGTTGSCPVCANKGRVSTKSITASRHRRLMYFSQQKFNTLYDCGHKDSKLRPAPCRLHNVRFETAAQGGTTQCDRGATAGISLGLIRACRIVALQEYPRGDTPYN